MIGSAVDCLREGCEGLLMRSLAPSLVHLTDTLSVVEAWWIGVGAIGVVAAMYDIWRAQKEFDHPWGINERAERGLSRSGLTKSLLLGTASLLNLTVATVYAFIPPRPSADDVLVGSLAVICLTVVELLIVAVTIVRDYERIFVRQFMWSARERSEGDPPLSAHGRSHNASLDQPMANIPDGGQDGLV
jgi:hypothetical protein